MNRLCIYHGGCTDGVAAAWVVNQAWRQAPGSFEFYPGVYQEEPPMDLIVEADEVLFVDFSYKRPVMERILERCPKVTVLDHHKTAEDDLRPMLDAERISGRFDMDKCGALLAWEWFYSGHLMPELLRYIDARDRWVQDHDLLHLDAVIIALRSYAHAPLTEGDYPQLFRIWDQLMDLGPRALVVDGRAIQRYYRQRVEETKPHMRLWTFAKGTDVLAMQACNTTFSLVSDVAGEVAAHDALGRAAGYWINADGTVTFSVRSCGDWHAGKWCESFAGGGGHAGAAGFKISAEHVDFVNHEVTSHATSETSKA